MTTEKPNPALLPCPFCGETPRLVEDFPHDNSRRMEFKVFCPNWDKCDVSPETPFKQFPTQAIDNWNKRVSFIDSPACSLFHPEIRYQGAECPLCEAQRVVDGLETVLRYACSDKKDKAERLIEMVHAGRQVKALSRPSSDPGAKPDASKMDREPPLPGCLPGCVHTPRDWGHSESGAPGAGEVGK